MTTMRILKAANLPMPSEMNLLLEDAINLLLYGEGRFYGRVKTAIYSGKSTLAATMKSSHTTGQVSSIFTHTTPTGFRDGLEDFIGCGD